MTRVMICAQISDAGSVLHALLAQNALMHNSFLRHLCTNPTVQTIYKKFEFPKAQSKHGSSYAAHIHEVAGLARGNNQRDWNSTCSHIVDELPFWYSIEIVYCLHTSYSTLNLSTRPTYAPFERKR